MTLGIEAWKPVLGIVLLPPVPFLLLILIGARLMFRHRLIAWSLVLLGTLSTWLMCCAAVSGALSKVLLMPPRALSTSEIGDLKRAPKTAIVVLGAGRLPLAPEYGISSLMPFSIERLRFAIWLSRQTELPVAFSGGVGHGAQPGPSEAEIAARIAEREFNQPLKWTESLSRDTNENAIRSLSLMREAGIQHIVLVTHAFHMRRALAAFERAKERAGTAMTIVAAPMDVDPPARLSALDWFPSNAAFQETRIVLHEWIGRLAGA